MKTIRELRVERDMTQLELAVATGVTPSTIYNWETGRSIPGVEQFRAVAKALGVSMDDIALQDAPDDVPRSKNAA